MSRGASRLGRSIFQDARVHFIHISSGKLMESSLTSRCPATTVISTIRVHTMTILTALGNKPPASSNPMKKHRTSALPCRHVALAMIAALIVGSSCCAQARTLTFKTVDDVYTISFHPANISEAKLRQLALFSPFVVSYLNGIPTREFSAIGATQGSLVDKAFAALPLELCIASDTTYSHCEQNEIGGPNFLRNARINIEKSRHGLTLLQHLHYPKELQPVAKFLEKSLEFSLWIEQTKFSYYSTWDENALKELHEGIDSAKLCPEIFQRLETAGSKEEKYRIVRFDWANCMIKAIDHQLGSYPIGSWNDFLKSYGITEHYEAKVPD
jgi:hypothetical protein